MKIEIKLYFSMNCWNGSSRVMASCWSLLRCCCRHFISFRLESLKYVKKKLIQPTPDISQLSGHCGPINLLAFCMWEFSLFFASHFCTAKLRNVIIFYDRFSRLLCIKSHKLWIAQNSAGLQIAIKISVLLIVRLELRKKKLKFTKHAKALKIWNFIPNQNGNPFCFVRKDLDWIMNVLLDENSICKWISWWKLKFYYFTTANSNPFPTWHTSEHTNLYYVYSKSLRLGRRSQVVISIFNSFSSIPILEFVQQHIQRNDGGKRTSR